MFLVLCNECGRKASRLRAGPYYSSFQPSSPPQGWWWLDGTCCVCKQDVDKDRPALLLKGREPATYDDLPDYERENDHA